MSRTTDIIISAHPDDRPNLETLSFWLRGQAPRSDDRIDGAAGDLRPIDPNTFGGHKTPTSRLWVGVANYLDTTAFTHHLTQIDWAHPGHVQALIKDEDDPWFKIYMLRNKRVLQLTPAPDPTDPEPA